MRVALDDRARSAAPIDGGDGTIESNWSEVIETFDGLELREGPEGLHDAVGSTFIKSITKLPQFFFLVAHDVVELNTIQFDTIVAQGNIFRMLLLVAF